MCTRCCHRLHTRVQQVGQRQSRYSRLLCLRTLLHPLLLRALASWRLRHPQLGAHQVLRPAVLNHQHEELQLLRRAQLLHRAQHRPGLRARGVELQALQLHPPGAAVPQGQMGGVAVAFLVVLVVVVVVKLHVAAGDAAQVPARGRTYTKGEHDGDKRACCTSEANG
jgi:hypothetical protein